MAKVKLDFFGTENDPIKRVAIATTGDSAYVFDDIANYIHKDGEFSKVPEGTKKLVITIDFE